jgi:hypothetical protein
MQEQLGAARESAPHSTADQLPNCRQSGSNLVGTGKISNGKSVSVTQSGFECLASPGVSTATF